MSIRVRLEEGLQDLLRDPDQGSEVREGLETKLRNGQRMAEQNDQEVVGDGVEAGAPLAELKPPSLRPYGLCAGEFTVPDDFDAPLPDEVLESFEG